MAVGQSQAIRWPGLGWLFSQLGYLVNITVKMITTAEQNPNREMSVTEGIEFLTYSPVSEAMWDPHVYLG